MMAVSPTNSGAGDNGDGAPSNSGAGGTGDTDDTNDNDDEDDPEPADDDHEVRIIEHPSNFQPAAHTRVQITPPEVEFLPQTDHKLQLLFLGARPALVAFLSGARPALAAPLLGVRPALVAFLSGARPALVAFLSGARLPELAAWPHLQMLASSFLPNCRQCNPTILSYHLGGLCAK